MPLAGGEVPCRFGPRPALRNSRSPIAQTVLASPGPVLRCSAASTGLGCAPDQALGAFSSGLLFFGQAKKSNAGALSPAPNPSRATAPTPNTTTTIHANNPRPCENPRMASNDCDTIIVGQGLAGSALAWKPAAAGQRVCVIDDGHTTSSSAVAAGLINRLPDCAHPAPGGRRLAGTLPDHWYTELTHSFGRTFSCVADAAPVPIRRTAAFHERRLKDPASRELLGSAFDADHCPEPITAPFGGFNQHRTGYVDLPLLMGELRGWLRQHQHLVEHVLEPTEVEPGKNTVSVAGVRAQRLVFCDGARLRANPWFDDLPLAPERARYQSENR